MRISGIHLEEIYVSDIAQTIYSKLLEGNKLFDSYKELVNLHWSIIPGSSDIKLTLPVSSGLSAAQAGDFGAYTDWTFLRPELADRMAKKTYIEMQDFLRQMGRVPNDNWELIEPKVKEFNRAIIINDPERKGAILYE